MSNYTSTITRTQTTTYTDVKNVIWKIKSDLYQIRLFHKIFNELFEERLTNDLFRWTYSNYCSGFKFTFFDQTNQECIFELRYKVTIGTGIIITNDDAGNIPFLRLSDKTFNVIVSTNDLWNILPDEQKQNFYTKMELSWEPSTLNLSYLHGTWTNGKIYSSNKVSASRSVFIGSENR